MEKGGLRLIAEHNRRIGRATNWISNLQIPLEVALCRGTAPPPDDCFDAGAPLDGRRINDAPAPDRQPMPRNPCFWQNRPTQKWISIM